MASDEPDKLMGQLASITDDQGRKIEYQTDLFGTLYVSKTNESYTGSFPLSPVWW